MGVRTSAQANPNATVAIVTTGPATLIVWLLDLFVTVPDVVGAAIAGVVISVVLAWGEYGMFGLWHRFLYGDSPPPE